MAILPLSPPCIFCSTLLEQKPRQKYPFYAYCQKTDLSLCQPDPILLKNDANLKYVPTPQSLQILGIPSLQTFT